MATGPGAPCNNRSAVLPGAVRRTPRVLSEPRITIESDPAASCTSCRPWDAESDPIASNSASNASSPAARLVQEVVCLLAVVGDPLGIDATHTDRCSAGIDGDNLQRAPARLTP